MVLRRSGLGKHWGNISISKTVVHGSRQGIQQGLVVDTAISNGLCGIVIAMGWLGLGLILGLVGGI